jgi:hypothetical protein
MSIERDALKAGGHEIGRYHATYSYPGEEAAGAAYKRLMRDGADNLSAWRYTTRDRSRWYITAIAERRAPIADAEALMRTEGAERLPGPPEEGMLDGLRERRWRTAIKPAIAGMRGVRQQVNYGQGARLDRHGRMTPDTRPQG